jgi:hypothetical protein
LYFANILIIFVVSENAEVGVTFEGESSTASQPLEDTNTEKAVCRGRKKQTKHFRSIKIQVKPRLKDAITSPFKLPLYVNTATSPVKSVKRVLKVSQIFETSSSSSSDDEDDSKKSDSSDDTFLLNEANISGDGGSSETTVEDVTLKSHLDSFLQTTRYYNKKESMHYLGIPNNCFFLVEMLAEKIDYSGRWLTPHDVVTLILRKIRRNFTFKTLSHMYGISEPYACRLFNSYVSVVASCLKYFVKMLPKETVELNLPLPFWARYKKVYIIIDTFEIKIKAPENAYDQSDTFSSYKNCNTVKYLYGIAPDGTVMYVSKGFVGRDSDQVITVYSEFVDQLPQGCIVMADRGFKNLESLLHKKGCKLLRPPSVKKGEILSKELSKLGQKIASLRSHVERSIGRIREFRMLNIHSALPGTLLSTVDDSVVIACGLVNCQTPLLKI